MNRAELVYQTIRDGIIDGTLQPDMHLVQDELAIRLGVSRQPVVQAMAALKKDGLVLEKGKRGLYVAPMDPEATRHHLQIHLSLDQLAVRLATERAAVDGGVKARLRDEGQHLLSAGNDAVVVGDYRATVSLDVEFHGLLYAISGNPLIATTARPIWHYLRRAMIATRHSAEVGPVTWRQHRRILEAMLNGDANAAAALMADHIEVAQSCIP